MTPTMNANKAWVAAIVAALTSVLVTIKDRTDLASMQPVDWVIVAVSAVVAGLTVYLIPNQPKA